MTMTLSCRVFFFFPLILDMDISCTRTSSPQTNLVPIVHNVLFLFLVLFFPLTRRNEFSSFTQSHIELFTHDEMMPSLIHHPFLANILIDFAMHHWQGMLLRALQVCRGAKNITTFWLTCPLCSHGNTDTHNAVINRCLSLTFWAPLMPWALFFFSFPHEPVTEI